MSIYSDDAAPVDDGTRYLPPECDVSIRKNWFWQPDDSETLKSLEHLLAIWYRSIGLGANLLLNIAPNREGRLDAADVARLEELTAEIGKRFANPILAELHHDGNRITATFSDEVEIDHLRLVETSRRGSVSEVIESLPTGAWWWTVYTRSASGGFTLSHWSELGSLSSK